MTKTILSLLLFTALNAYAFPMPDGRHILTTIPSTLTANYDFEGIVAMSNCSASFVMFETSKDSDYGMVLTNGHCIGGGFLQPGEVVVNRASTKSFSLYGANGKTVGRVSASMLLYATMTKSDMGLYKLTETYAQIKAKYNVRPLTIDSHHPAANTMINVVSGYWERGYTCSIDGFAYQLKEGDWTFEDSIRYSNTGCDVIGGTSGSPVIAAGTRIIVGVNNTTNENGGQCTINNPCEKDNKGAITVHEGIGYAQETYWIYSCLDKNNQLDTSVAGCMLPKPLLFL
jgi:V8-like Glu-specific endopeptidase